MKSLAVAVPRHAAETTRRRLVDEGLLRDDLDVGHDGVLVLFPILRAPTESLAEGTVEEREFASRAPEGAQSYRDLVDVPPNVRNALPRAFDVVGDVVLIRLPEELRPHGAAVGTALLQFVPGARLVGLDLGVHGEARLRRLLPLAGEGTWATQHRENGLTLDVDLERAYFSPRLAREHALVAEEVRVSERVLDFACGVGPFAAHIARDGRAREVVAVDSNPVAVALAQVNLARAGPGGRARAVLAPIESFAPSAGACERAILNLPHGGVKYLPSVAATVARGGSLHFYELTHRVDPDHREQELVRMLESSISGPWTVPDRHVVHPYSPAEDLLGYRFERA
ncbi:MAG: methyltransferase domain-containing protein [Thermoplasmata archaeon]|nr:methyltransferase domain-containing protein [Thermoplasmata archaeon]